MMHMVGFTIEKGDEFISSSVTFEEHQLTESFHSHLLYLH